jgi:large subunit ribosomal protein L22
MVKAILKNYRQSPRKVRLVAHLVKGKKVDSALDALAFLNKRAGAPVKQLIESAVANAKHNANLSKESLYVKELRVDKGITLHRIMPRARGSAARINKRSSHLLVILDDVSTMKTKRKARTSKVSKAAGESKKAAE